MADGGEKGMDGLLRELLLETRDTLDAVESYGAALIEAPADSDAQKRLRELVHTVKGTCGFLPLPRLEAVATAVTGAADSIDAGKGEPAVVTLETILSAVGRMRDILDAVDHDGAEPPETEADAELIDALVAIAEEATPADEDEGGGDAAAALPADDGAPTVGDAGPSLYVIFEAGGRAMALDAAHVAWLDVIEEATLSDEFLPVARVKGEMVPLCAAEGGSMSGLGEGKPVIVLTDGLRRVGLVVDAVVDVAADPEAATGLPVTVIGPEQFFEE